MKIGLLGVPFDANSSFLKGAAKAPQAIRAAFHSDSSNYCTENGLDIAPLVSDCGNVATFEEIEDAVSGILHQSLTPVLLGGDHSITYPIVKAFRKQYPQLAILHFDAHPDLYDNFQNNPYSHASPFARIMEEKLADRLVQVGIRTINQHQREQAERFGVEIHEMKNWNDQRIEFRSPVYISFDMDALDPAFAPGVSHPEPGGPSTRDVIRIIQSLKTPIVGADIVELNPDRDPLGITAMAAAKLLKEIAGKILEA